MRRFIVRARKMCKCFTDYCSKYSILR